MKPTLVYLGVGANLGDRERTIDLAAMELCATHTWLLRRAPLYRSAPVGPPGQPDYLNTVFELSTTRGPEQLLADAKAIERRLGRVPSERWGPRAIDLDLLLFGDATVSQPSLIVPHAELSRRRFVLAPLADLVGGRRVPGLGRTVFELLADVGDQEVERFESPRSGASLDIDPAPVDVH